MVGNSSYTNPLFRGAPDSADVPDFLKTGHTVDDYLQRLLGRVESDLSAAPKELHIAGLDGVLVSEAQYKGLKQRTNGIRLKGVQLVQKPTAGTVEDIIARAVQEVKEMVPQDYQQRVIDAVEGLRPSYTNSTEEAARALGVKLQPQE